MFERTRRRLLGYVHPRYLFADFGKESHIRRPYLLTNAHRISIGERVSIRRYGRIEAITQYLNEVYDPRIVIGDGAWIEQNVHIAACDRVEIGQDVVLASYVYISDHAHGFEDLGVPVMQQPLTSKGPVIIGDLTWIGQGSSILSGVKIGKHVVVGANSVVGRDVPDYCVVAGTPARVIKQYNHATGAWDDLRSKA
jgi:acetyltransferase-like isoleucine patch superfamily enzyme